jgi:hypothetical protein
VTPHSPPAGHEAEGRGGLRVLCSRCSGHGRTALPRAYKETLGIVRRLPGVSTRQVAELLGINHTATCNRLAWLRRHKLIRSTGAGKNGDPKRWVASQIQPPASESAARKDGGR